MHRERKYSDEAIQVITGSIHHHRQAAEIVIATLALVVDYMRADIPDVEEFEVTDDVTPSLAECLLRLDTHSQALISQLASDGSDRGIELHSNWIQLLSEIDHFVGRTDVSTIAMLRAFAIAARRLCAATLAAVNVSRRKESVKAARDAAASIHRLTCLYDLARAQELLRATTSELLVPINVLEGKALRQATIKPINVPELVNESIKLHTVAARRRGIEFRTYLYCATAYVAINGDDFVRALGNLFSNAIKYMGTLGPGSDHDSTWITVRVVGDADNVDISVESWGAPFTPEEIKSGSLFEWGTRGHFAWKVAGAEGSGVGLHDSRGIISRAGGQITISTQPVARFAPFVNTTTTVTIRLPRLDE